MPGQPSRREPRPRRGGRGNYRELIHLLNRRYHLAWERAERLEVELARARRWGLWPVFELLRRARRWLLPWKTPNISAPRSGSWLRKSWKTPGTAAIR